MSSSELGEEESRLKVAIEARVDRGLTEEEAFVISAHESGVSHELSDASDRISDSHPVRRPWLAYALATLACVIVLFLVECFLVATQSKYESRVLFEVTPPEESIRKLNYEESHDSGEVDKVDLMTEISIIYSQKTLDEVVSNLELDQKWDLSPERARKKIAADLTANYIRYEEFSHSRMLRVAFQGSDSRLAAAIPNAIAEAYRIRKTTLWRTELESSLGALQRGLKYQLDREEEARLRMLDLAERYRITPGDEDRIKQAEEKMGTAVQEIQLALVDASGDGERGPDSEAGHHARSVRRKERRVHGLQAEDC